MQYMRQKLLYVFVAILLIFGCAQQQQQTEPSTTEPTAAGEAPKVVPKPQAPGELPAVEKPAAEKPVTEKPAEPASSTPATTAAGEAPKVAEAKPGVPVGVQEISITAKQWQWVPSSATVKAYYPVRVTLTAIDDGIGNGYSFSLPDFKDRKGNVVNVLIRKGETKTVELTPNKTGNYKWLCQLEQCSTYRADMEGTLVVEEPAVKPPSAELPPINPQGTVVEAEYAKPAPPSEYTDIKLDAISAPRYHWGPQTLTLKKGKPYRLHLSASDSGPAGKGYNFYLPDFKDVSGNGIDVTFSSSSAGSVDFVPGKTGNYKFWCRRPICAYTEQLEGMLVVE